MRITCPDCKRQMSHVIVNALPGHYCEWCALLVGLAAWLPQADIVYYEGGSYWYGLKRWLNQKGWV